MQTCYINGISIDIGPGENLYGANLSKTDLRHVDLRETNLSRADLCGTNLNGANLSGARLYEANLQGAYLRRANLYGAELLRANLQEADLSFADLQESCLRFANMHGTDLRMTLLNGSDLRGTGVARITGLGPFDITIQPGYITIGCLRKTPEEWKNFKTNRSVHRWYWNNQSVIWGLFAAVQLKGFNEQRSEE